jgi:hypothetical protein
MMMIAVLDISFNHGPAAIIEYTRMAILLLNSVYTSRQFGACASLHLICYLYFQWFRHYLQCPSEQNMPTNTHYSLF